MKHTLFFSQSNNEYYWLDVANCEKCELPILDTGFLLWDYWKVHFRQLFYCEDCKKEISKGGGKYSEFKKFFLVESLPLDSILVLPERISLVNAKNIDVFDAATTNMDGEQIIDKSIASHNPNFMIQDDAKSLLQIEQEIKKKDEAINFEDINKYLT